MDYEVLHTAKEMRRLLPRATPALIAVAWELQSLVECGAISAAVLERLAQGLSLHALRQLAKTIRKEFEARQCVFRGM